MRAAQADIGKARDLRLYVPELDMTIVYDLATPGHVRKVLRDCNKDDDLKASALLVRDLARDEQGNPLVPRDDEGLRFLLNNLRPAVLGRIAKAIGGASAEELGEP